MVADVRELVLGVGDRARLKGAFLAETSIVYAGMPSATVFSLIVQWSRMYNSAAQNLYYPVNRSELLLAGRELVVQSVTPDEIRLKVYAAR